MATLELWKLSAVSDDQLLRDLSGLIATGGRLEARVVAHLAEVEERRLHLKAATSSLFDYCRRRMGLSESEAFHRITAARLARRFPVIFELLETRAIHLSALRVLRDYLTTENHRELLATASGKSTKDVEVLVAALAPRPDVTSRIRRLPAPRCRALPSPSPRVAAAGTASVAAVSVATASANVGSAGALSAVAMSAAAVPPSTALSATVVSSVATLVATDESGADKSGANKSAAGTPAQRSTGPRALEPLSPTRYLLRVSISDELKDKVERARELMSHTNPSGELALVLEKALDLLLEKLLTQRFAHTKRPRPARKVAKECASRRADSSAGAKLEGPRRAAEARATLATHREHISNEIRRAVAVRDGGQCTYVDGEGRRCPSRAFLQFHHEHPHALGGPATLENLRLLCGSHNRLLAERDFGRAHQARFAGGGAQAHPNAWMAPKCGPRAKLYCDPTSDECGARTAGATSETDEATQSPAAP